MYNKRKRHNMIDIEKVKNNGPIILCLSFSLSVYHKFQKMNTNNIIQLLALRKADPDRFLSLQEATLGTGLESMQK